MIAFRPILKNLLRSGMVPVVCLLQLSIGSAPGGDWPKWRGPDANGISRDPLPEKLDLENIVWRVNVGTGFSSIAVANGRVYTLGHDGRKVAGKETVWCLDSKTGEVIWEETYEAALLPNLHEGGPGATPTLDGDRLFTLSKDGRLHAYDAKTGKQIWQRNLMTDAGMRRPPEWGFAGSPLVIGDKLIVEAGATYALDKTSGEILWKSQPFRPAYGSPIALPAGEGEPDRIASLKTDGLVVLAAGDGATLAFQKWETAFSTNANTPIVSGNRIFISTGYDRGCALFEFAGKSLSKSYENQVMSNHMNNSVLFDGYLYGFDGTAHRGRPTEFVCLEFETGKEKWRVPPDEGLACGSVIASADGRLIILSERGELVIAPANPEAFEIEARAQVLGGRCWTPPAFADGRIFCRNAKGDLVAVAAGAGSTAR